MDFGARYCELPPLVQAANVRVKLARVAVAIAGRLFSATNNDETLLVTAAHVQAAGDLLDALYQSQSFGYADISEDFILQTAISEANANSAEDYILGNPDLAKFLRNNHRFSKMDVCEGLGISQDEANSLLKPMWGWNMLLHESRNTKSTPTLQKILRRLPNA